MKRILKRLSGLAALAITSLSCTEAPTARVITTMRDGSVDTVTVTMKKQQDYYRVNIPASELSGVETIAVLPDFAVAPVGSDGYFVNGESLMTCFKEGRDDAEAYMSRECPLPISVYKTSDATWLGIIKGLRFDTEYLTEIRDGNYQMSTIWTMEHWDPVYEDLIVDYYPIEGKDAGYSEAALRYRKYQIDRGQIVPLRDKIKGRPELEYIAGAPEIRIRMGWKPVPTPVLEQTLENEPPMFAAVTFDRVCDIVDELKAQGVEKAQLCLVGWNIKGHDGRFPDLFPVDPELGGEEALRRCIKYAQDNGYQIVPHTNRTDTYHISQDWNDAYDACKRHDGSLSPKWQISAGQMYDLCYRQSYDKYFKRDEPKVAALGFRGVTFIDVLSIVIPHECYDPNHPVNRNEAAELANTMLKEASDLYGGIQSEGGVDFTAPVLDFAMYTTMDIPRARTKEILDGYVPMWQLVYNGYILNNPAPETVNYTVKDPKDGLMLYETAGRPLFYFYSAYRNVGANWMGEIDLYCDTDENLKAAVSEIKKGWDYLQKYGHLQYETLDKHEILPDGKHVSTFSDGSRMIVDYTAATWEYVPAK